MTSVLTVFNMADFYPEVPRIFKLLQFNDEVDICGGSAVSICGEAPEDPPTCFLLEKAPTPLKGDTGDQELLAMKLALEEWQHWLEGAEELFLVLTDHENLEYLRTAKPASFNSIAHCLTKNGKADALARQSDNLIQIFAVGSLTWS